MKEGLKNAFMIGAMVVSWSIYYAVSKVMVSLTGSPYLAGFLLRSAALLFLTAQLLLDRNFARLFHQGKAVLILVVIGVFGFLLDLFANLGYAHGALSTGTALLKTDVLMVNLVTVILYHKKLYLSDWIGTLVMLFGVLLVLGVDFGGMRLNPTDLFFILSAMCVTANAFIIKTAQERFHEDADMISYYNNFVVLVLFGSSAAFAGDLRLPAADTINGFWWLVLLGGLAQTGIYFFYYRNLKHYEVWVVKLYLLLMPVVSCFIGVLFLGEELTLNAARRSGHPAAQQTPPRGIPPRRSASSSPSSPPRPPRQDPSLKKEVSLSMPYEGDNMMGVKRNNRSAALRVLHENGSMSRKRLSESIKLTPAAITKIVGEMIAEGLLTEGSLLPGSGVGRREVMVELNHRAHAALGIFINLRTAVLSAVWLDGTVIFSEQLSIPEHAPADETVSALCDRLMALSAEHGLKREEILGVGVAMRGLTSADARLVRNSFGALDAFDYPICDRVEARTGLKCVMSNNVRALFSAQMFLSKDHSLGSQFFLRCEVGIGASFSIGENIWLGSSGQCAEIGHIPVVKRGGKPCSCGKSGCLETIASPSAMLRDARELLSEEKTPVLWRLAQSREDHLPTLDDVFEAARSGEAEIAALIDRAVEALSAALKSVIYTLDPGKIVLYGRMFDNPYYLSKLIAEMREGVDSSHSVPIEPSRLNQRLEDKAAPLLMVEDFFSCGGLA